MTPDERDAYFASLTEEERQAEYRWMDTQCVIIKWAAFAFIVLCWIVVILEGRR